MKNTICFTVFTVIIFLCFINGLDAQNIWTGGTPGAETDWNNARNWSESRVPDWSDEMVIIPNVAANSGYFPVIESEAFEISCLTIKAGGKLTIAESGSLTVNGEATYNHGVLNMGELFNSGKLTVVETALSPFAKSSENIHNRGIIALGETPNETSAQVASLK